MQGGCAYQPGVAVDSRAGVPARIRLVGVIHLHGDHVVAGAEDEMRRHVVPERDVAEGAFAEGLAVDPHLAVFKDAFELDEDLPAPGGFGQAKTLAVPADAGWQAALGRLVLAVRPLDAPVVRHVQTAPVDIRKAGFLRPRRVALVELPAEVERLPAPGGPFARWPRLSAGAIERRHEADCAHRLGQQAAAA